MNSVIPPGPMTKPRMTQVYYFQHLGIAAYRVTDGKADWVLLKIEDPQTGTKRFISQPALEQEFIHLQQSAWYQLNHKKFELIDAYNAGNAMPGTDEWERFVAGLDNSH